MTSREWLDSQAAANVPDPFPHRESIDTHVRAVSPV